MAYSHAFFKPAFRLLALAVCFGVFSAAIDAHAGTYYVKKKETLSSETDEKPSPYIRKSRKEKQEEKEQAEQEKQAHEAAEEQAEAQDSEDQKTWVDHEGTDAAASAPQVYAQNCSKDDEKALREIDKKLENMEKGSGDKGDLGFFESDKNIATMAELFQRCGEVAANIMDN